MNDPDVILRVACYSDRHTDVPVIRQRFGPKRVDFEPWSHHRRAFDHCCLVQHVLPDKKSSQKDDKKTADIDVMFFHRNTYKTNRTYLPYIFWFISFP